MLEAADAAGTDEVCGAYVLGAHVCVRARESARACVCVCGRARVKRVIMHFIISHYARAHD